MKKPDLYYVHVKTNDGKTFMEKEFESENEKNKFVKELKKSYNVLPN